MSTQSQDAPALPIEFAAFIANKEALGGISPALAKRIFSLLGSEDKVLSVANVVVFRWADDQVVELFSNHKKDIISFGEVQAQELGHPSLTHWVFSVFRRHGDTIDKAAALIYESATNKQYVSAEQQEVYKLLASSAGKGMCVKYKDYQLRQRNGVTVNSFLEVFRKNERSNKVTYDLAVAAIDYFGGNSAFLSACDTEDEIIIASNHSGIIDLGHTHKADVMQFLEHLRRDNREDSLVDTIYNGRNNTVYWINDYNKDEIGEWLIIGNKNKDVYNACGMAVNSWIIERIIDHLRHAYHNYAALAA